MTTVLGSTHVVEQLSFSMFPSTLAFDFDLMLGSFLTFWALMGCSVIGVEFENCFVVYSCSCSTFILYVSVNSGICFYLILGSFLTFGGSNGLILGWGWFQQLFSYS